MQYLIHVVYMFARKKINEQADDIFFCCATCILAPKKVFIVSFEFKCTCSNVTHQMQLTKITDLTLNYDNTQMCLFVFDFVVLQSEILKFKGQFTVVVLRSTYIVLHVYVPIFSCRNPSVPVTTRCMRSKQKSSAQQSSFPRQSLQSCRTMK